VCAPYFAALLVVNSIGLVTYQTVVVSRTWRQTFSWVLAGTRVNDAANFRSNFSTAIYTAQENAVKCHTHGTVAMQRSEISRMIVTYIRGEHRRPYSVSMFTRDQRSGLDGERLYYWPQDLKSDFRLDDVSPDHVFTFIDSDHYVDINEYISRGLPIIIYGCSPSRAAFAKQDGDYSYTFDSKGALKWVVQGGGVPPHYLGL